MSTENIVQTIKTTIQDVVAPDLRELKAQVAAQAKTTEAQFAAQAKSTDARFNAVEAAIAAQTNILLAAIDKNNAENELKFFRALAALSERVSVLESAQSARH